MAKSFNGISTECRKHLSFERKKSAQIQYELETNVVIVRELFKKKNFLNFFLIAPYLLW